MVQETEIKQKEREENFSVESEDIHQRMYEITQNTPTTIRNPLVGLRTSGCLVQVWDNSMSNEDWRYTDVKMRLRAEVFQILLSRFGSKLDENGEPNV